MLLTNKERQRFISYLKQNIESSHLIVEQMKKLPGPAFMVSQEETRIAAWMVILVDLETTESFEISGKETDDA